MGQQPDQDRVDLPDGWLSASIATGRWGGSFNDTAAVCSADCAIKWTRGAAFSLQRLARDEVPSAR
jgi:hypothetical protein